MKKDTAQQIAELILEFSTKLDQSIELVMGDGDEGDTAHYKTTVGKIMGEAFVEILRPIYRARESSISPQAASRKIRIFFKSCRSAMNFARESLFGETKRNSGSVWRKAFETTSSDGGMPGRMVLSQEPKEAQTSWGQTTERYCSKPWAMTPAWMNT